MFELFDGEDEAYVQSTSELAPTFNRAVEVHETGRLDEAERLFTDLHVRFPDDIACVRYLTE